MELHFKLGVNDFIFLLLTYICNGMSVQFRIYNLITQYYY